MLFRYRHQTRLPKNFSVDIYQMDHCTKHLRHLEESGKPKLIMPRNPALMDSSMPHKLRLGLHVVLLLCFIYFQSTLACLPDHSTATAHLASHCMRALQSNQPMSVFRKAPKKERGSNIQDRVNRSHNASSVAEATEKVECVILNGASF